MKKIRVLQFTVAATKGGRTLYVLNNWKYIDKQKFQFDFVTFSKKLDFEQELLEQGCHVWHMSCYPEDNREQFVKEFDHILETGYDVIHIHTSYWKDTIVEERARVKGIKKIIVHAHSAGESTCLTEKERIEIRKKHNEIKEKLTTHLATDYWACSFEAAEWLFGDKIVGTQIRVLKNAIDVEKFVYNPKIRSQLRKELGLENNYVIGHVGNFLHTKNHSFTIELFCEVLKEIPEAVLLLVGDGKLKGDIEKQIKKANIRGKVELLGRREDINMLLQVMDVFFFPSLFEGFPLSLVEAQASGIPCIVSDLVTKNVQITDLVDFEPLNIDLWIEKNREIYRNRRERENMVCKLKNAGYEIHSQVKIIEELYLA